ncbi:hypothetical protein P7C70_g3932, partial [Phenoliferia sp. Uapishka_3]
MKEQRGNDCQSTGDADLQTRGSSTTRTYPPVLRYRYSPISLTCNPLCASISRDEGGLDEADDGLDGLQARGAGVRQDKKGYTTPVQRVRPTLTSFLSSVTTPDFTNALSATLLHLSSAGPERAQAESQLSTLLSSSPSSVLSSLIQIAEHHPDHIQRVLAFVLLRRFAFRPLPLSDASRDVWDLVDEGTRESVREGLISCLMKGAARKEKERGVICDVIAEVENAGLKRGGAKWPGLIAALTQLYTSEDIVLREAVFRIYSECVVSLLESEPVPSVIAGLTSGLKDPSIGVRIAALKATANLIKNAEPASIDDWAPLVVPMLDILPPLATDRAENRLTDALLTMIDLASTPKVPSRIFRSHLSSILSFSLSILTPSPYKTSPTYDANALDETVRQPALELLLSIAETAPSMTKSFVEFSRKLVPVLLNLMGEQSEDSDWLKSEQFNDDDEETMSVMYVPSSTPFLIHPH